MDRTIRRRIAIVLASALLAIASGCAQTREVAEIMTAPVGATDDAEPAYDFGYRTGRRDATSELDPDYARHAKRFEVGRLRSPSRLAIATSAVDEVLHKMEGLVISQSIAPVSDAHIFMPRIQERLLCPQAVRCIMSHNSLLSEITGTAPEFDETPPPTSRLIITSGTSGEWWRSPVRLPGGKKARGRVVLHQRGMVPIALCAQSYDGLRDTFLLIFVQGSLIGLLHLTYRTLGLRICEVVVVKGDGDCRYEENHRYDNEEDHALTYADGEKRYIIAPLGLKVGDMLVSGSNVDIRVGNSMPIANIPVGTLIHNVELKEGRGGQMVRAAGGAAQLLAKEGDYAQIRMPTGEVRLMRQVCYATIGQVGNVEHGNIKLGKGGRKRHMGIRPTVRGTAMTPRDHPHGGGEGRQPTGMPGPKSSWGNPTRGYKTRKNKKTDQFIVRRRNASGGR